MDTAANPDKGKLPAPRDPHLRELANCIRALAMDAVQAAKSGHPGMPMGMADIATVLFTDSREAPDAQDDVSGSLPSGVAAVLRWRTGPPVPGEE